MVSLWCILYLLFLLFFVVHDTPSEFKLKWVWRKQWRRRYGRKMKSKKNIRRKWENENGKQRQQQWRWCYRIDVEERLNKMRFFFRKKDKKCTIFVLLRHNVLFTCVHVWILSINFFLIALTLATEFFFCLIFIILK